MNASDEYWYNQINYPYTPAKLHHDEETDRTRMQEWCRRDGAATFFRSQRDRRAGRAVGSPGQYLQAARWSWHESYRDRGDLLSAWAGGFGAALYLVDHLRELDILPPFD